MNLSGEETQPMSTQDQSATQFPGMRGTVTPHKKDLSKRKMATNHKAMQSIPEWTLAHKEQPVTQRLSRA